MNTPLSCHRIHPALFLLLILVLGCSSDQPGGDGKSAIMEGQPTSYWIQQLKSDDPGMRQKAENILRKHWYDDLTVRDELRHTLLTQKNDSEMLIGIAKLMEKLNWDATEAVPELQGLVNHPDEKVSYAAAMALLKIDAEAAAKMGITRGIKVPAK